MSAYIVDKEHILYLVQAATSFRLARCGRNFSWWHNEHKELRYRDDERAAEVGNMLWCENIKSVSDRYRNESSATLPGLKGEVFVIEQADFNAVRWTEFDPVQVLKACDCYEYQSCEHDGWKDSESFTFIQTLRKRAWTALKGYEDAEWGCPPTVERRNLRRVA